MGGKYNWHDIGGKFGGHRSEHYTAMNLSRRIPTLEDGPLILWESNVIVRYLARKDPKRQLIGATLADDVRADVWMEWFQNNVNAPFITMFYHTYRLREETRDPQVLELAMHKLAEGFQLLNTHLEGQDFVCGNALSIGDIPVGSCLYRYFTLPIERPSLPGLAAYYQRLSARPAYRSAVMISYDSATIGLTGSGD